MAPRSTTDRYYDALWEFDDAFKWASGWEDFRHRLAEKIADLLQREDELDEMLMARDTQEEDTASE